MTRLRLGFLARRVRVIAALVAMTVLLLTSPSPAAAECNPPGADPSFRKAVPYASRVIVGEVVAVAPDGFGPVGSPSYRFTVAVEQVLRGAPASVIEVDHFETGGCIRWLSAAMGDRIVLAMDVDRSDPSIAKNTMAWLSPTPPESTVYESMAFAEVLDLVRLTAPDTSTAAADSDQPAPMPLLVALMTAAAALAVVSRLNSSIRRPRAG